MPNKTLLFLLFLFLISCLGQISSDLYLPALPTIRNFFLTTEHWTQISLAIYMVGYAVSHLIYGPISDHFGRKKPLLVGITLCIIGVLLCRFATQIDIFILGRLLQGLGAGAGAVLFLSITSDVYSGDHLAKVSSFLSIGRVILLASAPLIGSYLLHFFEWQACFTFLFIYTAICLLGSTFIYTETHLHIDLKVTHIRHSFKNIGYLLKHPVFMSYAFCVMLAFGGIVAWLTTLPFLLQDIVKLTPVEFGWVSALAGLFFIIGGFINAMTVESIGFQKMLILGIIIMLIGSLIMLGFGLSNMINAWVIMIPVIIYILGSSFIFSNAYAGTMNTFSEMTGTASAVFGFLQILGGAISSSVMSWMHNYNQVPLAITLMCSAIIALLVLKIAVRGSVQKQILTQ